HAGRPETELSVKSRLSCVISAVALVSAGSATLQAQAGYKASSTTTPATASPGKPDPRIGLRAGWFDAAQAAWNLNLVSTTPPSDSFLNKTNIATLRHLTDVQTCRGSHTHTVVTQPNDTDNVYIYVSGSAPVRSSNELAGCAVGSVDSTPSTALFRIEVIQVPLAHPEQAHIVSSPRIFQDLVAPPRHGEAPEDIAALKREID